MRVVRDVPAAEAYINSHLDHTSYHLLIWIRRNYHGSYVRIPDANKASILSAALVHAQSFNEWGILLKEGSLEGDPAIALVETGEEALPFIEALLDNHTPALLDGSAAATASIV